MCPVQRRDSCISVFLQPLFTTVYAVVYMITYAVVGWNFSSCSLSLRSERLPASFSQPTYRPSCLRLLLLMSSDTVTIEIPLLPCRSGRPVSGIPQPAAVFRRQTPSDTFSGWDEEQLTNTRNIVQLHRTQKSPNWQSPRLN